MSRVSIKNGELVALVNRGLLNIDYTEVDGEQAYKVYRFLRDVRKAVMDIEEQRGELVRRHVSDEELRKAQAYEAALKDKKENKEPEMPDEEYKAVISKLSEAGREVESLMNDTTDIDVRPVPFCEFFKMKKANKEFFSTDVDIALEGVLWQDEEEKEDEPAGAE